MLFVLPNPRIRICNISTLLTNGMAVLKTAWLMGFFIVTGALFLFYFKINRGWLIGSFLFAFFLQTILRAYVMEHIIPMGNLVYRLPYFSSILPLYFYMITDPATSPSKRSDQIIVGFFIAFL